MDFFIGFSHVVIKDIFYFEFKLNFLLKMKLKMKKISSTIGINTSEITYDYYSRPSPTGKIIYCLNKKLRLHINLIPNYILKHVGS